ncbi:MAG: diguanylate cyclase [Rhodospirillales bacterium]|nr:diguanylate cyclase [Rhodospirillales bacterium]
MSDLSLWPIFRRPSPARTAVSDEVAAALLATLFTRTASLVLSGAAGLVVSIAVFARTGSPWAVAWSVADVIVLAGRLILIRSFQREGETGIRKDDRLWARAYMIGGIISSTMLGVGCFFCLLLQDQTISLLSLTVVTGTAGGLSSRNAALPRFATLQIILMLLPVAAGAALGGDRWYLFLTAEIFFYIWALASIVDRNHRHLEGLMLAERANAALAARFDAALTNMPLGLCMFDADGRLAVVNGRVAGLCNVAPEAVRLGLTAREFAREVLPDATHEALLTCRDVGTGEMALADGRTLQMSHHPMDDGGSIAIIEDVSERRRAEARVLYMARHDPLTGLSNRSRLMSGLVASLAALPDRPAGAGVTVLYLDLDGFKTVNDSLGHAAGDALLKLMADRLTEAAGEGDIVARLGGDEFAVVQPGGTLEAAVDLAQRLVMSLGGPQDLGLEREVRSGVSIGIARAPDHGMDADALLARADMALYAAKAAGKGRYRLFEPEMDIQAIARRALEQDLRDALLADGAGLLLHYQPIVDLATGRVVAREALIRWDHPLLGLLPPVRFIPLAEDTGLIVPLGQWVVEQACRDAARWTDRVSVAVNISPAQLGVDRDLPQIVAAALAASGLPVARFEIEITESALLRDDPRTLSQLHLLATAGVAVALDDFGTGFSSLVHLRAFPFDKIKIDGSFVRDATERADCAAIVRALADLGTRLAVATVAEGIETEAQLALVRREGCRLGQGWLFGRPEPASAIL